MMIGSGSLFEIVLVISLQDFPDPDRQRDFFVIGREQRLVLCIQADTPDALCDENMISRTCGEIVLICISKTIFLPSLIAYTSEIHVRSGAGNSTYVSQFSDLQVRYIWYLTVSYTHLRAHETDSYLVC